MSSPACTDLARPDDAVLRGVATQFGRIEALASITLDGETIVIADRPDRGGYGCRCGAPLEITSRRELVHGTACCGHRIAGPAAVRLLRAADLLEPRTESSTTA